MDGSRARDGRKRDGRERGVVEFVVDPAGPADAVPEASGAERVETGAGGLSRRARWAAGLLAVLVLGGVGARLATSGGSTGPVASAASGAPTPSSAASYQQHPAGQLLADIPDVAAGSGTVPPGPLLPVGPDSLPPCPEDAACSVAGVPAAALAAVRTRIPGSVPTAHGQLSTYLIDGTLYFREIQVRAGTFTLTVQVMPATSRRDVVLGSSTGRLDLAQHPARHGYLARFGLSDPHGWRPADSVLSDIATDPRLVAAGARHGW